MDIRLIIWRLRPNSAYQWMGGAFDDYGQIGTWLDANTLKPTLSELTAEDVKYQTESAAISEHHATIATTQADAVTKYATLPDWARTMSAEDAATYINAQVWNGISAAEADAWIDANVTSLATAKTAMKQIATAIINMRGLFVLTAQLLIYIRDLVIRFKA